MNKEVMNVKRYNVGGNKFVTIIGSFMCIFLIIVFMVWVFMVAGNDMAFKVSIVPCLLVFGFMEFLGMMMIVKNELGIKRMKLALTGKKAWGTVKESYMSSGRNAAYHLTISYKNEWGQAREIYCSPSAKLMNKFVEGKRVPILVKGEFAFFDLEEINKITTVDTEESIGNFCTNCGAKISPKDKFCKNCGNKL